MRHLTDEELCIGAVFRDLERSKEYRVVRFSMFRGGYLDGERVVTYEEPDGCSWTMTAYQFRRAGFEKVEKRAQHEESR